MTFQKAVKPTILLFIFYSIVNCFSCKLFDSSSKEDLISNYNNKEKEILELKNYFNSIVPDSFNVYIEFSEDNEIDLSVFGRQLSSSRSNRALFQLWDINPYEYKQKPMTSYDSSEYETNSLAVVKQKLNWNDETFKTIKRMLDKANCISISNGEPADIGFARSGMGKYSYVLFNKPLSDSLKKEYNDSCTYIFYRNNIVLEYGGGAIGSQCFPDK